MSALVIGWKKQRKIYQVYLNGRRKVYRVYQNGRLNVAARRGPSIQPSRILSLARYEVKFSELRSELDLLVSQRSRKNRNWWRLPNDPEKKL